MPGEPASETVVTYTVRDLFERVDGKLNTIDSKLDTKADKEELHGLERKLLQFAADAKAGAADLDRKVQAIEAWRNRAIGLALGLSVVFGGAAGAAARLVG